MLKKTISYTDYEDNERKEDFYFNLTKAELTEMELSTVGGLKKMLEKIVMEQDTTKIVAIFKGIIEKAYGEKSDDGKRFIKVVNGRRLVEDFEQTEAYSNLFMELISDADAASAFIKGMLPLDLQKDLEKQQPAKLPKAVK